VLSMLRMSTTPISALNAWNPEFCIPRTS
jgi:hypothetical protein